MRQKVAKPVSCAFYKHVVHKFVLSVLIGCEVLSWGVIIPDIARMPT